MKYPLDEIIKTSISNDLIRLTIFPTEQCNFRCIYCYEYFKNPKMNNKTLKGLLHFLDKRLESTKLIYMNWFGGEPLLAKDIIFKVSKLINNKTNNFDCIHIGNITTNGYLLDIKTFSQLVQLGIKNFQLTLDGPEDQHNKSRKLRNGGETFDVIWNNLFEIKKSNISAKINIRIHFTKDNYQILLPFINTIEKELLCDERFYVYFKAIEKFGGPNDENISFLDDDEKSKIENMLNSQLKIKEKLYINEIPICYAAQLNAFSIRSNGLIQKCDLALDLPENNVGFLKDDGTLDIDVDKFTKWSSGLETLNQNELSCPYKHLFLSRE